MGKPSQVNRRPNQLRRIFTLCLGQTLYDTMQKSIRGLINALAIHSWGFIPTYHYRFNCSNLIALIHSRKVHFLLLVLQSC